MKEGSGTNGVEWTSVGRYQEKNSGSGLSMHGYILTYSVVFCFFFKGRTFDSSGFSTEGIFTCAVYPTARTADTGRNTVVKPKTHNKCNLLCYEDYGNNWQLVLTVRV